RYRVRRGDTLSSVARQFRVSIDDLRRWNGIRGSRIVRGAVLKVYPGGRRPTASTQRAARTTRTTPATNATEVTAVSASATSGGGSSVMHEVKPGETLWSIARAYRTTVEALRAANQFLISRQLKAGDQLVILAP
ncbi:MAG: LysM peptidoglycan-binding domain-containing protein, partial [Candidatus Acidiferrales bacterium]